MGRHYNILIDNFNQIPRGLKTGKYINKEEKMLKCSCKLPKPARFPYLCTTRVICMAFSLPIPNCNHHQIAEFNQVDLNSILIVVQFK